MQAMKFIKTIMKNFTGKPATCMYPVVKREFYGNTRGSIGITIEACIYCGLCSRKCPTGAIKVDKSDRAWEIDRLKCIACGYCVDSCPKKCLNMLNQYSSPAIMKEKEVFRDARVPDHAANS